LESQYGLGEARNIAVEFDLRRRPDEANPGTAQRHRDDLLRSARHSSDATRTSPGSQRKGDTINVMNTQSKRVVQAVVIAPGRVAVAAVPARVVESAPASAPPASPSPEPPQPEHKVD
jgi:hypothetical protein